MLHLIWMFIVGVVVGAIARWIDAADPVLPLIGSGTAADR